MKLMFGSDDLQEIEFDDELLATLLKENLSEAEGTVDMLTTIASKSTDAIIAMRRADEEPNEEYLRRFHSMLSFAEDLLKEAFVSVDMHKSLDNFLTDMRAMYEKPYNPLHAVVPDWKAIDAVRRRKIASRRSRNFATFMRAKKLPICDAVYEYLQSTKEEANTLLIANYTFAVGEIQGIFEFFLHDSKRCQAREEQAEGFNEMKEEIGRDNNGMAFAPPDGYVSARMGAPLYKLTETLLHLSITNCELTDNDCYIIAMALPAFLRLQTVNLRKNEISSVGASNIAMALYEMDPALRTLKLDYNQIGPEGMGMLAKV
jgi:DNA-binding LacI/PurR family transcriptional regulator